MDFIRRKFSRKTDNTRPGGDNRSGIPSSQRSAFDAARYLPAPSSEVEQHQQPLAWRQRALHDLETTYHQNRTIQERVQAEINDAITVIKDNTGEIEKTLNQGDRSPEQPSEEYKQIKQAIQDAWPRMLATQTPTASYHLTREFKDLRNRKSELRTDPNAYVDKLRALHARMFDPATEIQDAIESQYIKRGILSQNTRINHSNVLHKLENLPDNGLGNEDESRQNLIDMYKAIENKFNKTVKNLNLGIIPSTVASIATLGLSAIYYVKKQDNLIKSALIYHNWIITIYRHVDAFHNRNQSQPGTQGIS
jgi:predicted  nucleic acid-binding Zn-ribbon protein